MGRRSSRARKTVLPPVDESGDDEDDSFNVHSRRKRQKINYAAIENSYDDILDENEVNSDEEDQDIAGKKKKKANGNKNIIQDEEDDDIEDDLEEDPEEEIPEDNNDDDYTDDVKKKAGRSRSSRTRRSRSKSASKNDDDDASFNEDESDALLSDADVDSDASFSSVKRRRDSTSKFITKNDDEDPFADDDDDDFTLESKKKKSSRPRSRRLRRTHSEDDTNVLDDDSEEDTLGQEIADLHSDLDGSPQRSASQRARSLRERKKDINYTIPPPLSENVEELSTIIPHPATPKRRGGATHREWRLFPTGGPFGGGDVTSLFGKNYAGSGGNLLAGGADSDSSDDEIIAVNGTSKKNNSISTPINPNKSNKKKQPADSDPLGVDMNIDFSAVGGLDNYINQLKEMVALPLLYPEVYQRFGITPPRGVLFHGPPGTGKTLMARALAASCSSEGQKITFFMRKGADCLSKWVGEAERQLRLLFEEARKQQPSIIFFDEIDGLAPVRSSKQEQIHASIVSTLLALMDGMDNRGQVIVIGATNRPDAVDPALRRPGRFDREFYFPLPDLKAREEILAIHTKKWDPPLAPEFLKKVALLTKGYGGADLRALCTEAALNSIQRRYPQIYASKDKLKIDPAKITVAARDFMKAIDKIVPSSSRSTASGSFPLPDHLISLLGDPLAALTEKLDKLVPRIKKLTSLEEAQFVDPTENDPDGGFAKHEFIKRIETSRVHRPRLLISGTGGNGQQYLGSAVLNHLEGFNVQSLDLGTLFGDSTRTAETAIIQSFIEARRHKPSIIYIPNIDIWFDILPVSAKATLSGLLRSVSSNERILLLGVAENKLEHLDNDLKLLFGISEANFFELSSSTEEERMAFFEPLWTSLQMPPTEFLDTKTKKKLEKLEKVVPTKKEETLDLKSFEKADMSLKNTLKIKLSGLMDLFKNRYKKFKKPAIDPIFLIHLFEPMYPNAPAPLFTKDGDMIVEIATGKRYYNMDLDIIEERLWNGFYSEPKQFMKDIEMIYLDCVTLGDRERLIKGSEMYANTQVAIDELSTPEFVEQCKALRKRELMRIRQHEEEQARLRAIREKENEFAADEVIAVNTPPADDDAVNAPDSNADVPVVVDDEDNGAQAIITNGEVIVSEITSNDIDGKPEVHSTPSVQSQEESVMENGSKVDEQISQPTTKPELQQDESVDEEEDEEEEEAHPDFELDLGRLQAARKSLVDEARDLTVEYLEQVNAKLMDILWEDHRKWNRNETLSKIISEISKIRSEFE